MDAEFRVLERIMQAANIRQRVIASNIANSDTPGYKAKDVKFGDLLGKEIRLMTSDPKHFRNSGDNDVAGNMTIEQTPSWGDGNNVELNVEVAKMTENSLMHNAAVRILNAKIKLFRSAISTRR